MVDTKNFGRIEILNNSNNEEKGKCQFDNMCNDIKNINPLNIITTVYDKAKNYSSSFFPEKTTKNKIKFDNNNNKTINEYTLEEVSTHNKITDCWLVIDFRVYNVTEYLEKHPGGVEKILENAGKDATEVFEEVGHSSMAYQQLNKYVIGRLKGTSVELKQSVNNTNQLKRLFTHEDRLGPFDHIHKILGLCCLIHYIYRISNIIVERIQGKSFPFDSGMDDSYTSLALMWMHALLQFSSFIFHIPKKQTGKPMIWQEFRSHNSIFLIRSILCFTLCWLSMRNYISDEIEKWLKAFILLAVAKGADIITEKMREANTESTTRTLPYWDECPTWVERSFKVYYCFSQFGATLSTLWCYHGSLIFIMFPIQLASLLMTLVRKGIISTQTYHVTYMLSLILGAFIDYEFHFRNLMIYSFVFALVQLRTKLRINKYTIWFSIVSFFCTESKLVLFTTILITLTVFKRDKCREQKFLTHKNEKKTVKLISKIKLTHDVWQFKFETPQIQKLGLQLGEHITVFNKNPRTSGIWNNQEDFETESTINRKYTPIKVDKGSFTLAIKEYKSTTEYPDGGKMSKILSDLKVDDSLVISGPCGHNTYLGNGKFLVHNKMVENDNVVMVCAGTGITPMFSILTNILETLSDKTKVTMLYVNKTMNDVMMKEKLDELKNSYKDKFNMYFCVTREKNINADFNYRPNKSTLSKISPNVSQNIYLLCGPHPFTNSIHNDLRSLNVESKQIVVF